MFRFSASPVKMSLVALDHHLFQRVALGWSLP